MNYPKLPYPRSINDLLPFEEIQASILHSVIIKKILLKIYKIKH